MYRLTVESGFASAHQLREYEGTCERLHGHNWRVQVTVKTDRLNRIGIGIDFKLMKTWLNEILSVLDHAFLNEVPPFTLQNPSSENLARFVYEEFEKRVDGEPVQVEWVRVWESAGACAQYSEE